ncbi:MAG TPA: thiamine-phosphate kinase [Thermoanaerobaculia bacterium]
MKAGLPPEDAIVQRLAAAFATRRRDVKTGIGDDAAILAAPARLAVTTDVLLEDHDFRRDSDPRRLGRKALSVNLSDLAAMGATPLWAVLALGLPKKTRPEWLDALTEGVREAAAEYGVAVVGGDLSASEKVFISVTVMGQAPEKPLLRSGAEPGDSLFVSGTLGAAAAGLRLLEAGYRLSAEKDVLDPKGRRVPAPRAPEKARLIRHQIDPRPQLELGQALAQGGLASAAIDVSDGLARDLYRVCRASDVGATVEASLLPADSALSNLAGVLRMDPLATALYGAEDFGLLFTVPRRKLAAIEALTGRFALRRIGTIDDGAGVRLVRGGKRTPLPDAGFDHFAP